MTICLATRGYIYPRYLLLPNIRPEIVQSSTVQPIIGQAVEETIPAPVVYGSAERPSIRGAVKEDVPPTPASPSIVKGRSLVPVIRKAKKVP